MLDVQEIARWLSGAAGRSSTGSRRRPRLDGARVLAYLRTPTTADDFDLDERDRAELDRQLSSLPRVIVEQRLDRRHHGFARYFEAMPLIAHLHQRGHSSKEIADRMRFMATDYGVETVMRLVCDEVARRFNRA